jgi:DnaK suppressor protein
MDKKMDKKTLEQYRKRLLDKRRDLTAAYTKNRHYGRESDEGGTQDLADKASSSYTKEFLYSLSNTERSILEAVEEAIDRMADGEYGVCLECGERIARKRLDAVPWATYCVPCQERIEAGVKEMGREEEEVAD